MRIYRIRKFPAKLSIFILVILVITFNSKIRSGVKNITLEILVKPFKAVSGVKTYLTRAKNLSEENLLLKQRLGELSVEVARMKGLGLENARLGKLLDFKKSLSYKTIVAKVIARDSTDWRRAMIINKGRSRGIREHMPCVTTKGLVGSVVEVAPASSKVMLITDPNSRIGVVLESSRESGVLVGSSQGTCKVIYLSLDADIKVGEKVLTAGFSDFFPKGLMVGKVIEVGIETPGLYKYAAVDPVCDMDKIEEVICIEAGKSAE